MNRPSFKIIIAMTILTFSNFIFATSDIVNCTEDLVGGSDYRKVQSLTLSTEVETIQIISFKFNQETSRATFQINKSVYSPQGDQVILGTEMSNDFGVHYQQIELQIFGNFGLTRGELLISNMTGDQVVSEEKVYLICEPSLGF